MNEKYPLALPVSTVLAGQYIIQDVLGQGGFGITYKALDRMSGREVAVKEYFPEAMATRLHGNTNVTSYSGDRGENFVYGMQCFMKEAETLAQFIGNENIVRIYSYFEEYGTAYFVMDYIEGTSLNEYVKQRGGKVSFEEASDILVPIMDALGAVHQKGIVHRDVSPDNIYITNDGKVKLIDFGAARQSLGDKSQSLDIILKHGFAPKEQYMRRGKQGPFTDIYALGATFYYILTGRRPPDALERMDEDELIPLSTLGVKLSKAAEDAILMALNVQPEERFQSMGAFKNAMLAVRTEAIERASENVDKKANVRNAGNKPKTNGKAGKKELIIGGIVAIIVLAVVVMVIKNKPTEVVEETPVATVANGSPIIEGNNINNIIIGNAIDVNADKAGTVYADPNNSGTLLCSISKVGDTYYAVDGSNRAVTFNVNGGAVSNVTAIPEISGIEGVCRLLVSEGYYFVCDGDSVWSVNRINGSSKKSQISSLGWGEYTFTETGKFCYLDWDGHTGYVSLYCTPADNISGNPTKYEIEEKFSGSTENQIICGSGDKVYVYLSAVYLDHLESEEKDLNKLFEFDLSGGEIKLIGETVLPTEFGRTTFSCDGENVFYDSIVDESTKLSQIGILNTKTGETTILDETTKTVWEFVVYPNNKGTISYSVGTGSISDQIITVP